MWRSILKTAAATIHQIARLGSMSPNTFYANFRDKREALLAAIDSSMAQMQAVALAAYRRNVGWAAGVSMAFGSPYEDEIPPEHVLELVARCARLGAEHVYVADVQEHADEMAHDAAHAEEIHRLANTSGIVVPLIARGRTLGTIQLGTVDPQPRFTDADVEMLKFDTRIVPPCFTLLIAVTSILIITLRGCIAVESACVQSWPQPGLLKMT